MKRHGCLIGAICCIVSPILFFVGILASVYPGSILEGPVNLFIFWLFTVLSIALCIIGIVFIFIGLILNLGEERGNKKGDDEIIDYSSINCAKCNTEISESDKTCPKCGVEFGEE
ncbi:hypothetical protein ACFLYS_00345 [Chloroflexota bacterium]